MTLIILLCGLAVEYFLVTLDNIRQLAWFSQYNDWLENKFVQSKYWSSATGVCITLAGPLLLVLLIDYALKEIFSPLSYLFALIVLLNSIGPIFLNQFLNVYVEALDAEDDEKARHYTNELFRSADASHSDRNKQDIVGRIFVEANERIYAVIFWFVMLGPFGAMFYRLANILKQKYRGVHGGYADSVTHLNHILNWPSVRLFAMSNALAGNMLEAIAAWKASKDDFFSANESILVSSGFGALHYRPKTDAKKNRSNSYWIRAIQDLLNRTLIIWLTVLGLMTIAGVLL